MTIYLEVYSKVTKIFCILLQKSRYYQQIAMRYQVGIQTLLWNEKDGIWYDYDMLHKRQRNIFYPSNFAPLYTRSYNIENRVMYAKRALNYIRTKNITSFLGQYFHTYFETRKKGKLMEN